LDWPCLRNGFTASAKPLGGISKELAVETGAVIPMQASRVRATLIRFLVSGE
jgi:hypothetical protein